MTGRLDLDVLLTPLPGELPAGRDVRTDFDPQSPYFRLRDARAEARAAERQADAAGASDDAAEGIAAFLTRRRPTFHGR